jgi:hypothetical protein
MIDNVDQILIDKGNKFFKRLAFYLERNTAEVAFINSNGDPIYSMLDVFDDEIILDVISCLINSGFTELGKLLKGRINAGNKAKNIKEIVDEISKNVSKMLSNYTCKKGEISALNLSELDQEEYLDLAVGNGINPDNITHKVANLIAKVSSYSIDLKKQLDFWELEYIKQFKFCLNENIDDHQLELIFSKLKSTALFDGSETDFVSILRGKGKGDLRISVNRPSTLLTMIRYFVENHYIIANAINGNEIVQWDYIAENFIKIKSKPQQTNNQLIFKASNLRKNLKNSNTITCINILDAVLNPS